ncbi:putative Amyotrophic lateral sclerosis 2 chromosomal region candidate 8-containing protein 1, partial [Homarus americanus]
MEESITIKVEDPQTVEEAVINAEIVTDPDSNSARAEKTIELPCSPSTPSHHDYFDVMLKHTFGYVYTVEKANETLSLFQERTLNRFVCYKVQRSFGRDDWTAENHKILWHQDEQKIKTENYTPMYDGIPYILLGSKLLECQFGIDRNVYQKQKHYAKRNVST